MKFIDFVAGVCFVVFLWFFLYFLSKVDPPTDIKASSILYLSNSPDSLEKRIEKLESDVKDIRKRIRENEDILKKMGHGYQR